MLASITWLFDKARLFGLLAASLLAAENKPRRAVTQTFMRVKLSSACACLCKT